VQDEPPAALLVAEARLALDAGLPAGFPQRVAANALGIAQRELERGPALAAAERARLAALLGRDGALAELNAALAEALRTGAIDLAGDALIAHLIATTVAKMSIDQPGYPGFRTLA
jgi:hypothetical protein